VVADLDDTLWGGIVGELGAGGVALDPHGPGRPYLHLQRFLKDLSERGVPISIVSKNNLEDARAPFVERSEMILKLSDIVCFEASWDHKYKAIKHVAQQLGLPVSAICLLDDSPHERAEARHFLPDLIVPELDEDPEERLTALINSGLFWIPAISAEDKLRTAAYQTDKARRQLAATKSLEGYLRELDMRMEAIAIDCKTLNRVGALVQKTNQFNLTNRRHGPAHLANLVAETANYAHCFSVHDRFGESGIVGVLISKVVDHQAEIDTFLLSCRVLNRGVEFAMIEHFRNWLAAHGIDRVAATNLRSKKNQPTWELLPRFGFAEMAQDGDNWHYAAGDLIVPQHFVTLSQANAS
jgi:FkbH-like protein